MLTRHLPLVTEIVMKSFQLCVDNGVFFWETGHTDGVIWLMWSQSHHHLLAVFHCCVPFVGYQWNIESISRSACWPTRLLMRNSPFTFAPWLLLHFHHAHWDQTEESVCRSLGLKKKNNTGARSFSFCTPSPWNNLLLSVNTATSVARRRFKTYPFNLPPSPRPQDTGVPNGLLMWRNSFNDFVFEHRSGCCTTEPGYGGDIDAIESWLVSNN